MAPPEQLENLRNDDGGFGSVEGAPSEAEPTAMLAQVFDDQRARAWLLANQRDDGSFGLAVGSVFRDVTPLGALALRPGPERERALDYLVGVTGRNGPDPAVSARGWPWTDGAHGWTEPTAWGLLALRVLRPAATDRIDDARAVLRERECVGGGWNYGSRIAFEVQLAPYVQTTAVALLALGGEDQDLLDRGTAELERSWSSESEGLMSLATATCALRAVGSRSAGAASAALERAAAAGTTDCVTFAWIAFATEGRGLWNWG